MDYEKAYKEALERAKKWYYAPNADKIPTYANRIIPEIFPELKESEDDRIRKEITEYITHYKDCITDEEYNSWIAWLEKQGEKIDAIENFDTEFEKQVSCLIASVINKEYEYNQGYVKWAANALLNYAKHELEKQGEQKHDWSEEDEVGFRDALWAIERAKGIAKDENDMGNLWFAERWLKSLKVRMKGK